MPSGPRVAQLRRPRTIRDNDRPARTPAPRCRVPLARNQFFPHPLARTAPPTPPCPLSPRRRPSVTSSDRTGRKRLRAPGYTFHLRRVAQSTLPVDRTAKTPAPRARHRSPAGSIFGFEILTSTGVPGTPYEVPGFRAGSPRVIAHPGLPQIPTCGFPASGSSSHEFAA